MAKTENLYFHSAEIYTKPEVAFPTPRRIGVIQEVSLEVKGDLKELFGEENFAEDASGGNVSVSGKYKSGELDPAWADDNILGGTQSAGILKIEKMELQTVDSGAVTVDFADEFDSDYGVVDPLSGAVYTRVATAAALAPGQYKVDEGTGIYSFHTSVNGKELGFTYLRGEDGGVTHTVVSKLAGSVTACSMFLNKTSRAGTSFGLLADRAIFESWSFGFKLNEYTMPEGAFKVVRGQGGRVFRIFRGAAAA